MKPAPTCTGAVVLLGLVACAAGPPPRDPVVIAPPASPVDTGVVNAVPDPPPVDAGAPMHLRACGRAPSEPIVAVASAAIPPRAQCDAISTSWANVPSADRACEKDADCIVVYDPPRCHGTTLNRTAAAQPKYQTTPCASPGAAAAGMCGMNLMSGSVTCDSGCCVVRGQGVGALVPGPYPKP